MPYTGLDHFIARQRFRAAYPHIRKGARVCDLGCGLDAAFLDFAAERKLLASGVSLRHVFIEIPHLAEESVELQRTSVTTWP